MPSEGDATEKWLDKRFAARLFNANEREFARVGYIAGAQHGAAEKEAELNKWVAVRGRNESVEMTPSPYFLDKVNVLINGIKAQKEAALRQPSPCGVAGHLMIEWVTPENPESTPYCLACVRERLAVLKEHSNRQRIIELEESLRSLSDEASNVVGLDPDSNLACLERRTAIARALLLPESIE